MPTYFLVPVDKIDEIIDHSELSAFDRLTKYVEVLKDSPQIDLSDLQIKAVAISLAKSFKEDGFNDTYQQGVITGAVLGIKKILKINK